MIDVKTILAPFASKKNIVIEYEVDIKISTINADKPKFKQIVYNLMTNAIKFTPEGGSIKIIANEVGPRPASSSEPP